MFAYILCNLTYLFYLVCLVHGYTRVCEHTCLCTPTWRSEVNFMYLPLLSSTLLFNVISVEIRLTLEFAFSAAGADQ